MLNYLGACENFSVMAGTKWESVFAFTDEVNGEPAELDGVTFSGRVVVRDADMDLTLVRADAYPEGNVVQLVVPPLPEGRWRYEIYALAETGYKRRLLYGYVSSMGIADWDDAATYANRTLEIALPGDASKPLRAEWKACTAAMLAAKQATEAAKGIGDLKNTAQNALDRATEAVDQLDGLDGKVQTATDAANRANEYKETCQGIADNLPTRYVPSIGANGNWWLNGEDQGVPAVGRDGRDGSELLRVMVNSVADIPATGDGSKVYYVPRGDGSCDCYVWTWTDAAKTNGQWSKANEAVATPTPRATFTVSGTLMLGTAAVLTLGAPVGVNAAGRGFVPPATAGEFGACKLSMDGIVENGLRIGRDASGALVCEAVTLQPATLTSYGTVKLGSRCTVQERVPYLLSVATNEGGSLCNNLVRGGALQHRRKPDWVALQGHMAWMDTSSMTDAAYDYYFGLHTSGQFTQTEENGLELLPATEERVGGVTVHGNGHDVYTKDNVDATVTAINSAIADVRNTAEHSVRANATLMSIQVLTESAYDALTTLTANTLYIVHPD